MTNCQKINNAKLFAVLTLLFVLCSNQSSFAQSGRKAYLVEKAGNVHFGELLAVKDNHLIFSTIIDAETSDLTKHPDSILVFKCNEIQYIKMLEKKTNVALGSTLMGLGIGTAVYLTRLLTNVSQWFNLTYVAVGAAGGLIFGLIINTIRYSPDDFFYPDCINGFQPILYETRFQDNIPRRQKAFFNKLIQSKLSN